MFGFESRVQEEGNELPATKMHELTPLLRYLACEMQQEKKSLLIGSTDS